MEHPLLRRLAVLAVTLPLSLPRTSAVEASAVPGHQRWRSEWTVLPLLGSSMHLHLGSRDRRRHARHRLCRGHCHHSTLADVRMMMRTHTRRRTATETVSVSTRQRWDYLRGRHAYPTASHRRHDFCVRSAPRHHAPQSRQLVQRRRRRAGTWRSLFAGATAPRRHGGHLPHCPPHH